MKQIVPKIAAVVAVLIGIMAPIAGTRVLSGSVDPGYATFPLLIYYNITMGLVSILAGLLIWKNHPQASLLAGFITIGHVIVLLSLLTVFNDIIASQSIQAMTFRSVVWVVIYIVVSRFR